VNSFKARGALTLVHHLKNSGKVKKVITASTGNHGSAMAYACNKFDMPITVVVPEGADRSKVELIKTFGADLQILGQDLDESKDIIQKMDLPDDYLFIEDGAVAEIVAGTSTIGYEITKQQREALDIVFVPLGNGSLIGGIGSVLKHESPGTRIIGVQSDLAPCMSYSFQQKVSVNTESCDTFAGGIAVRVAIPEAVDLMLEVVDDVILVSDEELKESMALFLKAIDVLVEGAGAAALAGALKMKKELSNKSVCLIASGSNVDKDLRQDIITNYAN
jgi:threonine dehydratase